MDSTNFSLFTQKSQNEKCQYFFLLNGGHVNILQWMIYSKTRPASAGKPQSITLPCNTPLWGLVQFPSLGTITFYYVLIAWHQTIISVLGVLGLKRKTGSSLRVTHIFENVCGEINSPRCCNMRAHIYTKVHHSAVSKLHF